MRLTVERKVPVTWCVPRASVKAPSSRSPPMRRHVATFVAAALLLSLAGPAFAGDPLPAREATADRGRVTPVAARGTTAADPTGRWIVVYKNGTNVKRTSTRLAKAGGFTADRTFTSAFRGLTARLNPRQVTRLRMDPAVLAVVPDEKIELAAQLIPTGIDRINGSIVRGREDRRRRSARRRRRGDRRHGHRHRRRSQCRRRLQLFHREPLALAGRPWPRDPRRRDRRCHRQRQRRGRRRSGRPAVGRQDPR